jgi:hypothetical protein
VTLTFIPCLLLVKIVQEADENGRDPAHTHHSTLPLRHVIGCHADLLGELALREPESLPHLSHLNAIHPTIPIWTRDRTT